LHDIPTSRPLGFAGQGGDPVGAASHCGIGGDAIDTMDDLGHEGFVQSLSRVCHNRSPGDATCDGNAREFVRAMIGRTH